MNDRANTHPHPHTHTHTQPDRDADVNGNGTNHSEDVSMQQHSVSAPATTSTETTTSALLQQQQQQPHTHPTETQANSSTLNDKHRPKQPQPLAVNASFDSDFSSTTNSTFAQSDTRRSFSYAESAATIGESSVSSYFPLQKYLKLPQQQQHQYGVRSPDRVSSGNILSSSSPLSDGAAVAELALPSGWTTAARAQDGRMYYWNVATGETRWEHPGVSMKDARPPPQSSSSSNYRSGGVGCNVEKSSDLCGFRNENVIGETIEKGVRKQLGRECHVMDRNICSQAQTYQSPTKDNDINALHEYSTPNGNAKSPLKQRSPLLQDTPTNANLRPDSHQCCAVISFFAFPPLGCCAVFHSCMVDRAWSQGRYGDSVNHSRQSYNYAWFGVVVFIVLFVYYAVSGNDFEWENWIPSFGD